MGFREFLHHCLAYCPELRFIIEPLRGPMRKFVRGTHFRHVVALSSSTELEFVQSARVRDRGKVVALMCVRNEIDRLAACLVHYRAMGVREFCVVDNGSTDGTFELLKMQDDIHLYRTGQSYKKAYYGITWINYLFHKHCVGQWALFVDADELLYLDREDCSLDNLVDILEACGQSYLYAPMVDLYDFDDDEIRSVKSVRDISTALKYSRHDVEGYTSGHLLDNGFFALTGGPRGRIARMAGARQPFLVKFPLVKYDEQRYFTASSHEFMPDVEENHREHGWLVHLKLGNQMARRHSNPAIESEHYGAGGERIYLNSERTIPKDCTAQNFDGIRSLMRLRDIIIAKN